MIDFRGMVFTHGVPITVIYWKESTTLIRHQQLDTGLKQGEEVMKKSILWREIPGGMRSCMLIPIMKFVKLISIMRLTHSEMVYAVLTTTLMLDLTGLLGMGDASVMTTPMMIMTTNIVWRTRTGRITVKGTMSTVDIVMTQTMKEAVGKMVIGDDVNPVSVNVTKNRVVRGIRVHIEDRSIPAHVLVVVMIA